MTNFRPGGPAPNLLELLNLALDYLLVGRVTIE